MGDPMLCQVAYKVNIINITYMVFNKILKKVDMIVIYVIIDVAYKICEIL